MIFMQDVDILLNTLEPEIEAKCAEIKRKKSERALTAAFVSSAAALLIIPTVLTFFGVSLIAVFLPLAFVSAALVAASPLLISKGVKSYE